MKRKTCIILLAVYYIFCFATTLCCGLALLVYYLIAAAERGDYFLILPVVAMLFGTYRVLTMLTLAATNAIFVTRRKGDDASSADES